MKKKTTVIPEQAKKYVQGMKAVVSKASKSKKAGVCRLKKGRWKSQDWKALVVLANHCVRVGHWKSVERVGSYLGERDHLAPWGPLYMGLVAEEKGQLDRALWMFELAGKKAPNLGLIKYHKSRLHWKKGNHDLAVVGFEKALELNDQLLGAHLFLGQVYHRDQQYSKAREHYERVIDVDPKQLLAWIGMGKSWAGESKMDESLAVYEKANLLFPKNVELLFLMAQLQDDFVKNKVMALVTYRRILSLGLGRRAKKYENIFGVNVKQRIQELDKKQVGGEQKLTNIENIKTEGL